MTELQKFCLERQMKLVYVMPGLIGKISLPTMTEIYSKLESFLESSGINYVDTPKLTLIWASVVLALTRVLGVTCCRVQKIYRCINTKQKAESAFQQQRVNRADARSGHCAFISFDMEKTLPLPKLSVGEAFYLRQLWLIQRRHSPDLRTQRSSLRPEMGRE